MKRLKAELAKLQDKNGKSSLATEIEALLGVKAGSTATPPKETPLSQKFLALAAAEIGKGNFNFAHDCIGAAIEVHTSKTPVELTAEFQQRIKEIGEVKANDSALKIPLPELGDEKPFTETSQDLVTSFADALISAGYSKEAKKYIEAYNASKVQTSTKRESEMALDKRKALLELRDGFKKSGRLDMVRAADEMMDSMKEDEGGGESKAGMMMEEAKGCPHEGAKSEMMKASYMMKAAEDMKKDGHDSGKMMEDADGMMAKARDMLKEQSEPQEYQTSASAKKEPKKPVLYVEAASPKEKRLRDEASRAASRGDMKKAKVTLSQADSLERSRLIAALILAGDSEMAMEGLKEEEENGGYPSKASEDEMTKEKDDAVTEEGEKSEMPPEKTETDEPTKESEEPEVPVEEPGEEEMAKDLQEKVESAVKRGRMRAATAAFAKLTKLEEAVVAGVKLVQDNKKLAKEGFGVWKAVAKARLTAQAVLADKEGEDEEHQDAMEGMEKLDDESTAHEELDKALEDMDESKAEEITKDFVTPPGGKPESAPSGAGAPPPAALPRPEDGGDEGGEEGGEEEGSAPEEDDEKGEVAESMHYDCLLYTSDAADE